MFGTPASLELDNASRFVKVDVEVVVFRRFGFNHRAICEEDEF
jgi:hypothetical protein